MTALVAQPLDEVAFTPYGTVVQQPDRPADADGPGWRWWAETAALAATDRPFCVGFLDLQPAPLRFDWAERHDRSPELIVALAGDCLVYVGNHSESFEVFRLRAGQSVILNAGVWHGAPLAADGPARAMVLLREGTGAEDTAIVRFSDQPLAVEV